MPPLRHHRERFLYYGDLNDVWQKERVARGYTPNEFQVYLYDFGEQFVDREDLEVDEPDPLRAWVAVVGRLVGEHEEFAGVPVGQPLAWPVPSGVRKGDLVFLYETAPESAIVAVAFARTDAFQDPFFDSGSLSCAVVQLLCRLAPVRFAELRDHPVLSGAPFVRTHGNASPLSLDEFEALRTLVRDRSVEARNLPALPRIEFRGDLLEERDVELSLVEPLLERLGLGDRWRRQVRIRAGRGSRVIPDYVIDAVERDGIVRAHAIVETKFRILSMDERDEAFRQAHSYAMLLGAKTIVVAAADGVWWWRARRGGFVAAEPTHQSWKDLVGRPLGELRSVLAPVRRSGPEG